MSGTDSESNRALAFGPELGLGLYQGAFVGVTHLWLLWYDNRENWIPTDAERATRTEAQLQKVALKLL